MSDAGVAAPANGTCPRCGAEFRCGMAGGDAECWCAALPPVAVVPAQTGESDASCLCPRCLRERIGLAVATP